jgi:integrase
MRNDLDKSCRENKNMHFVFGSFFRKSSHLWDNVEKYGGARGATDYVTIWRMRVACWISKATCTRPHAWVHTHGRTHALASTHTPLSNTAFPQQQWFHERTSVVRYTYIACLVLREVRTKYLFVRNCLVQAQTSPRFHYSDMRSLYPVIRRHFYAVHSDVLHNRILTQY